MTEFKEKYGIRRVQRSLAAFKMRRIYPNSAEQRENDRKSVEIKKKSTKFRKLADFGRNNENLDEFWRGEENLVEFWRGEENLVELWRGEENLVEFWKGEENLDEFWRGEENLV